MFILTREICIKNYEIESNSTTKKIGDCIFETNINQKSFLFSYGILKTVEWGSIFGIMLDFLPLMWCKRQRSKNKLTS